MTQKLLAVGNSDGKRIEETANLRNNGMGLYGEGCRFPVAFAL
jgi:hypothetical protein